MNPHGDRMLNLATNLTFGFFGFDVLLGRFGFLPEVSVGIHETGNFVFRLDRAPSISLPFAGESEVQAEVGVGMGLGVGGDFGEPGAGDHDAGGSHGMSVEGV